MANKANNAFYEIQFRRLELMQSQLETSESTNNTVHGLAREISEIEFPDTITTKFDEISSQQLQGLVNGRKEANSQLKQLVGLGDKIYSQVLLQSSSIAKNAKFILVLLAQLRSQALLDTEKVTVDSTNKKLYELRDQDREDPNSRYQQSLFLLQNYKDISHEFSKLFAKVDGKEKIDDVLEERLLNLMMLEKRIVNEITDDQAVSTKGQEVLKQKEGRSTANSNQGEKS
ncbi:MAG: hypothetical protein LUQ11_01070 [Methylococcaceae bacterium]|nr:hypothetical protein [Methylococcaceae bacterium]